MNIEELNADKAKNIADSSFDTELTEILYLIQGKAQNGEYLLHVSKQLHQKTIDVLRKKEFKVINAPSIAVHHTISWD